MRMCRAAVLFTAILALASAADAACVNKFTRRAEGARNIVTLLTGKLTFQAAKALATAIHEGKASPLEWVDPSGKSIAKQFGELRVVRPMPVGCDGNLVRRRHDRGLSERPGTSEEDDDQARRGGSTILFEEQQ